MTNCYNFFVFQRFNPYKNIYTHNKYLAPQLKGDNDPVSGKTAAQIFRLNLA